MSVKEIDQTIKALPDHQFSELADAAIAHWSFRVQTWLIAILLFGAFFAFAYAMHRVVSVLWPGSLIVGAVAAAFLILTLLGMLKAALSYSFTQWRLRGAMRRQFGRHNV